MSTPDATPGVTQPTLKAALRQAASRLQRGGIENAGNEARRLAAAVLGLTGAQLLSQPERPLGPQEADRLGRYVERRLAREPISRILGERDFYGRSFAIGPATLDPRPDSETLIVAALELVGEEGWLAAPLRILDVGTGSGCLLLTLLAELPNASGVGTDTSQAALQVARANAQRLGLWQRSRWLVADALDGIAGHFDILVSNPPYIPTSQIDQLEPEVLCFDPHAALDGGVDGLQVFRRLAGAFHSVVTDGWIVLEVGHDQAEVVVDLVLSRAPTIDRKNFRYYRDVAGKRRCVAARTRN
jgi:release factor glutamine methyltransferase